MLRLKVIISLDGYLEVNGSFRDGFSLCKNETPSSGRGLCPWRRPSGSVSLSSSRLLRDKGFGNTTLKWASPCSLVSVFFAFVEEILFIFDGFLFPLENANQVRSKAVLAKHVEDVQQVGASRRILAVRNSRDVTATRENTILLRIAGHPPGLRVLGPRTDGAAVAWVQDLCEDDPQDDEGFGRRAR